MTKKIYIFGGVGIYHDGKVRINYYRD